MSTFTGNREETVGTAARSTGETEHRIDHAGPKGNRFLIALVVVLAAAVVGLGAWLIIDQTSSSDVATTDEVQQLIDDYHDAWNDHDGDAYLELVTDDAVFVTSLASTPAATQARTISAGERTDWQVEPVGEPIMTGDGPWYVAQANRLTAAVYPDDGYEGLSILTIVDDDGTLLVDRHLYVGQS
jgi:hypothetical protein